MSPNHNDNDNDRRHDRPTAEDNPFIAFRHFADSAASALFNGITGLPGLLAEFNNIHLAREQCLYGKADVEECKKLKSLEDTMESMQDNEFNLDKAKFDLQKWQENMAKYMKLEANAIELRKNIVESGRGSRDSGDELSRRAQTDLVERVGNQKGQQWGWSWDWGFPRPFDSESEQEEFQNRHLHCRRWHNRVSRDQPPSEALPFEELAQFADGIVDAVNKGLAAEIHGIIQRTRQDGGVRRDAPHSEPVSQPQSPQTLDVLPREQYSPYALENSSELKGGAWRDAFEDLLRVERGVGLIPPRLLGQSRELTYDDWVRRFKNTPYNAYLQYSTPLERDSNDDSEIPYEYSHDHEDQHDDPPTPRPNQHKWTGKGPETELEAYERLLRPEATESSATVTKPPSILATLTTTERTVAPDGTITTKVVLKKRFSDGKEESSETVHTHRGDGPPQDPWKAFEDPNPNPSSQQKSETPKKKGWFWSH